MKIPRESPRNVVVRSPAVDSPQLLLAMCSLTSGLALLLAIYFSLSLATTLGGLFVFVLATASGYWRRLDRRKRFSTSAKVKAGVLVGVLATASYDVARVLVVQATGWQVNPFKAFPIFGQLIVGQPAPSLHLWIAGSLYHLLNGVCFALGYTFALGGRHWMWGMFWGLGLEAIMLAVYPGWLNLDAVLAEFTIVSIAGHLAYGLALGLGSRALPLCRPR